MPDPKLIKFQQGIYQNPTHFTVEDSGTSTDGKPVKDIKPYFGTEIQPASTFSAADFSELARQISYTVLDTSSSANTFQAILTDLVASDLKNNLKVLLVPNTTNTSACSINLTSISIPIKKEGNVDLVKNDIINKQHAILNYSEDFNCFQLLNPQSGNQQIEATKTGANGETYTDLPNRLDTIDTNIKINKDNITFVTTTANENKSYVDKLQSDSNIPPQTITNQSPTSTFDVNNGGVTPIISGSGSTITNLGHGGSPMVVSDLDPVKTYTVIGSQGVSNVEIDSTPVALPTTFTSKTSTTITFTGDGVAVYEDDDTSLPYIKGTQNLTDLRFEITSDSDPDFKNEVYSPVTLTSKDNYVIEGGKMVVDRNVKVVESLDGVYYDFSYISSPSGYKEIGFSLNEYLLGRVNNSQIVTKYNEKNILNITNSSITQESDQCVMNTNLTTNFKLSVSNNDSGWGDSYTPTVDEVNAYMNGWVMSDSTDDLYESGDKYWNKRYQGIGTSTELSFGTKVEFGSFITVVPKEKAYGDITETYKLQYDLATPVSEEIDLFGDMTMPEGEAYVTAESGVRFEKATPIVSENIVYINDIRIFGSELKKKANSIVGIIYDDGFNRYDVTDKFTIQQSASAYGKVRAFDNNNLLTKDEIKNLYVKYKTLSEENNTNVFNAQVTYKDDLINVIEVMGQKIAYQAEQLDITEMRIEELTKEVVLNPTWLQSVNGDHANITVKNKRLKGSGYIVLNGATDDSVILKTSYKPVREERFAVASDNLNLPENYNIEISEDGEWIVCYESTTPSMLYLSNIDYEVK